MSLVWHYTNNRDYPEIVRSGALKTRSTLIEEGRKSALDLCRLCKPILWFSREQNWEPDATWISNATGKRLSMDELNTHAGPLYRFGVSDDKVLRWPELMTESAYPALLRMVIEWDDTDGRIRENHCGIITPSLPLSEVDVVEVFSIGEWKAC